MKLSRTFVTPVQIAAALAAALAATAFAAPSASQPPPPEPETIDLKTAVGYALENNFAIRQARERIKEQEGVIVEVKARAIPNVGANGSFQLNEKEISQFVPATDRAWTISVTATQALFAGGGIRSSIRSSELAKEAAILDLQDVINSALLEVRTDYYQVLLAREKITVQEENLKLLEEQLKTTTDRFDAGTVSGFEKLRAEVAVANAKTPLITARNDYRLAIESLREALGLTPRAGGSGEKTPTVVGELDYAPQDFNLQTALSSAEANRPDLKRLAKLVAASEQGVTTARSGYLPTLGLAGGYQLRSGESDPFASGNRDGQFVGLQSNWEIYDGRATSGRVAQARSIVEQNRLSLMQTKINAEVDVRRAYSSWQESNELVEASRKVVEQAQEAVRLANARYSAGTGTQLDVLQAQVDLTTARTNQVQAYYTYNVAVADLRRAMGLTDALVAQ
ncbi:MAG TPA: TolC family protein [Opitutus sp.]|nr:TolC family protein [Opitutus sp.]